MFKKIITVAMLSIVLNTFTLPTQKESEENRQLHESSYHNTGNILLRISNYGFIGSGNNTPKFPSLTWPKNSWFNETGVSSGVDFLYYGALWIGAKKIRRNNEGEELYWQNWPNPVDENDCIPATHPDWNSDLKLVIDTLTSVGYDGDRDLYELLPAYNPLEASSLGNQFYLYNHYDRVFFNRYGEDEFEDDGLEILQEAGFPFFPIDDINCSNLGSESSVAYYYDYSPFPDGYSGIRHYGSNVGVNIHYPLEIAIKQETLTYPVQFFSDVIFMKHTIYNTSEADTLYDMSLGFLMDIFIYPNDWGAGLPPNNSTIYVSNNEFGFPYSYDLHLPGKVALSFLNQENNDTCWSWELGDGPDDSNPRNLYPDGLTANEKYWLMTDRNPDTASSSTGGRYWNLKEQEHAYFGWTRYLYSVYGDMQGFDNPTEQSFNLAPGEHKEFASAIFLAYTEEELIHLGHLINDFYASGFDENLMAGLPSIPRLMEVDFVGATANLHWKLFTMPDELYVYYKYSDAPAITWEKLQVEPANFSYTLYDLAENENYKFKLGAYFGSVYLESNTITIGSTDDSHPISPKNFVTIYPNPFNSSTNISFELKKFSSYSISVFNTKGQKVFSYQQPDNVVGKQTYQWNGKDKNGVEVSSGIYFFQVKIGNDKMHVKKAVLMK
jgi:hypothetical protein